jgi:hypothetical protein
MNFSPQNMITIGDILADVLSFVDDTNFRTRSEGWYESQAQQALEELSYDTRFLTKYVSVDIPENLHIDIPKGMFNPQELYVFNGDECTIHNRENVWLKRNFINSGDGNSFVARNTGDNHNDPFYRRNRMNQPGLHANRSDINFYNIVDGVIMLSPSCRRFQKLMIVANAVACDIGDAPIVPAFMRQAVKDWIVVKALPHKMKDSTGTAEYSHWSSMLAMTKRDLEDEYEGSWIKAERRAKKLDEKYRTDLKEYLSKLNY